MWQAGWLSTVVSGATMEYVRKHVALAFTLQLQSHFGL